MARREARAVPLPQGSLIRARCPSEGNLQILQSSKARLRPWLRVEWLVLGATRMVLKRSMGLLLAAGAASGCVPSQVIGPLQHEQDERNTLLVRARKAGASEEILTAVAPPLTTEEVQSFQAQSDSCRTSYLWKNALTWTGGAFVGLGAGLTIGAAYATNITDKTDQVLFGVSAGSFAALGSILVIAGEIVQQGFTDRGCWVR